MASSSSLGISTPSTAASVPLSPSVEISFLSVFLLSGDLERDLLERLGDDDLDLLLLGDCDLLCLLGEGDLEKERCLRRFGDLDLLRLRSTSFLLSFDRDRLRLRSVKTLPRGERLRLLLRGIPWIIYLANWN